MPVIETRDLTYTYGEGTPVRQDRRGPCEPVSIEQGEFVGADRAHRLRKVHADSDCSTAC